MNQRLSLSDGTHVERREVNRDKEKTLHQTISRTKKGSNNRKKRVKSLRWECYRNKVRNRKEYHRITTGIVKKYGKIAVEKTAIQNLTKSAKGTIEEPGTNVAAKSGLNRSILEQTWGQLRQQLTYKAEWAGREYVEVNPRNTSKTCSGCGSVRKGKWKDYRVF